MRKPVPAYLMTAVVLALAGSAAYAQTAAPRAAPSTQGTSVSATGTTTTTSTTRATNTTAPRPTANTNTSTSATPPAGSRPRVTGVTAENTTGSRPVASTTTGTSVGNSVTLANADGTTTTTTLNADGTRTLVTTNRDGTTTTTRLPENLFNPALVNGTIGGVTADGERLPEGNATVQADSQAFQIQERVLLNAEVQRSSASLDRVIRDAEKERKKVGRNGQLLHSIAPRTNADRSHEMPDDGPTPVLSGLSNSLIRR